ncbi:uncharacterized protein LOC105701406 [Orussus abietinus]|uniref:uncharacterized protein LOC105701406 n=1 Tax=Orussus abietinus TaxID=222816 RepID=UPI00062575DA|nr:uncharacterized protein LOC105701406 [Orussus abietinus]XP_023288041.1 uncharacterized protein LOC105701406 [Orussus abietinus]
MGQMVGRMPDTWEELLEERNRVLHWSAEVLARVDDNMTNEDTFLMDYDNDRVNEKVEKWVHSNRARADAVIAKYPDTTEDCIAIIDNGMIKIIEEMNNKMRKDYRNGYSELRKFTKRVDRLGYKERQIHASIERLESECQGDPKKFQKKLGPLRLKVFDNLEIAEKIMFQDKRYKTAFTKKVYDIDHENMAECAKRFEKLLAEFERCAQK